MFKSPFSVGLRSCYCVRNVKAAVGAADWSSGGGAAAATTTAATTTASASAKPDFGWSCVPPQKRIYGGDLDSGLVSMSVWRQAGVGGVHMARSKRLLIDNKFVLLRKNMFGLLWTKENI